MISALFLYHLTFCRQAGADPADRLRALSMERQSFQRNVVESRFEHDKIDSMPFAQHIRGYYPLGKGDRRYLIYLGGDEGPPISILYQSLDQKGRAQSRWQLQLKRKSKEPRFAGTFDKMLNALGVEVSGKVTAAQKKLLNEVSGFAAYEMAGDTGGEYTGWIIHNDGAATNAWLFDDSSRVPITPEESDSMGLGKAAWPPSVKLHSIGRGQ